MDHVYWVLKENGSRVKIPSFIGSRESRGEVRYGMVDIYGKWK